MPEKTEETNQEKKEKGLLGKLEETLVKKKYLTGEKITVIDIMFYCEIVTICKLYNREIPRDHCSCVADWYDNIAKEPSI